MRNPALRPSVASPRSPTLLPLQTLLCALLCWPALVTAEEESKRLRLDAGLTFSRIEQQAKVEVGEVRGERLVEQSELGSLLAGAWRLWGPLSAGWYAQFDMGTRHAGKFAGFDAEGKTTLSDVTGGDYWEFWTGPLLRGEFGPLFLELGYGLFGIRGDDARADLASSSGDTTSALRTMPTVAWIMSVGGAFRVAKTLDVVARLSWRIRYYDRRGGEALANDMVHGTMSFQPFFGVAWRP